MLEFSDEEPFNLQETVPEAGQIGTCFQENLKMPRIGVDFYKHPSLNPAPDEPAAASGCLVCLTAPFVRRFSSFRLNIPHKTLIYDALYDGISLMMVL